MRTLPELKIQRRVGPIGLVLGGMIACCGCQTWQSTAAIPGMGAKRNETKVLQQAKNDPFPSPSDVGLKMTK
ncbi:MAG: hypothetical protein AAGD11_04965 [Planctomycetota bacterium]